MTDRGIIDAFTCITDKFGLDVAVLGVLFFSTAVLGLASPIFIYLILYLLNPSTY